ncbi:T9SS type A sorting domain-containing protein [Hymenobacter jeollabukensis]|uniref:T9SS type A sorting domain-containing protein n=1 Tax=Hymenobacter jeollabukensis TaxID=2025313 RepID=A0A5R8WKR8_9BACT|nr:T9SS type A sorting domain-containing protein [Hymenobacter jeollabukensis]TLM89153.1 T9SS type A sorting domain-containing protein [Hymenobacter jeollabukensis]
MKAPLLLALGLLGLSTTARAQAHSFPTAPCYTTGPLWFQQNLASAVQTPPWAVSQEMRTVDGQTAWQLLSTDHPVSLPQNRGYGISRTDDWGQTWQYRALSGGNNLRVEQLTPTSATMAFLLKYDATWQHMTLERTTDGGTTWNTVLPTAQLPRFPLMQFSSATEGLILGQRRGPGGGLLALRTTDGGSTWAPLPAADLPTAASPKEIVLSESFTSLGNTMWVMASDSDFVAPPRLLRSTDRGLHWTASAPIQGMGAVAVYYRYSLAFKDVNNGLLASQGGLLTTTNGGNSWQAIANTGTLHTTKVKAIPGTQFYMSVGPDDTGTNNYGVSYSYDQGLTWHELASNTYFSSFDYANSTTGYFGAYTDANGQGGVYRTSQATLATQPAAAGPAAFSLAPNPSPDGTVQLHTAAPTGARLRICDVLGREVYARTLPAATGQSLVLDLAGQAKGVYIVSLTAGPHTQQQRLVLR